ncbi:hypothetical protein GCM10028798_34970 [Humibacter antri]
MRRHRGTAEGVSLNSGSGEDVLGAVDRKDEEESVTGGDADDEDAGSGRTGRTAAQPELRDTP